MNFKRKWIMFKDDVSSVCATRAVSCGTAPSEATAMRFSVLSRGDIKLRTVEIWKKSLLKLEDVELVETTFNERATHVVLPRGCTINILNEWTKGVRLDKSVVLVTAEWVVGLIERSGHRLEELHEYLHPLDCNASAHYVSAPALSHSQGIAGTSSSRTSADVLDVKPSESTIDKNKFACARSGDSRNTVSKANEAIVANLLALQKVYEADGDQWRALSYKKACAQLSRMKQIQSLDDLRNVRGIGSSILEKIEEIMESGGSLNKLEQLSNRPGTHSKMLFAEIWGVGPKAAQSLVDLGYSSIDELRQRGASDLTIQQRIGLAHYEDFKQRIPREEVDEIVRVVLEVASNIAPDVEGVACGSYRRGKMTCGDVDILFSGPPDVDSNDQNPFSCIKTMLNLLDKLRGSGFLTDDLSVPHTEGACDGKASYMGVCKLNRPGALHRRIDIKVYPRREFASALLSFTGSDYFNRSMRFYANKIGHKLTDEGLWKRRLVGVGSNRIEHLEYEIPCTCERDIFAALDLPYKEPWERDCIDASVANVVSKAEAPV